MNESTLWILLVHVAATWGMVGLIWFVQMVHYPLYTAVGEEHFVAYETAHNRLTSLVVIPFMLTELATAVLLLATRPPSLSLPIAAISLALVLTIWLVTFTIQVPQHARLCESFDLTTAVRLVQGNWIRTVLWSARGSLVLWMLARSFPPSP